MKNSTLKNQQSMPSYLAGYERHVGLVGRVDGFLHAAGAGVVIAGEWPHGFASLRSARRRGRS